MSPRFAEIVAEAGSIPLGWAGSTTKMDYLNFGDALSPVMVALCAGLPVHRVPFRSNAPRLAAVGTIGHGFEGGTVWFWGTGSSNYRNPSAPLEERVRYHPPPDTEIVPMATRGPVSRALLGGGPAPADAVFGDPVWLLPRFYRPELPKRWELGVILHLSEIADRALEAHPHAKYQRYRLSPEAQEQVHLINTITPIALGGLKDKLDEILACKRLISTSLHGMVIAESYGIPCLYFPPNGPAPGLARIAPEAESGLDLRIVDLYQGLGKPSLPVYVQDRLARTDWNAVIRAIDAAWEPVSLDGDALMAALPLPLRPLEPASGGTIFDHPVLNELTFQHDVVALGRLDRTRHGAFAGAAPAAAPVPVPVPARPDFAEQVAARRSVPLSWVASTRAHPFPNLGDALSPVIVSAIAGLPIDRRHFDDHGQRLVSVGTIGQGQRNGIVHFWGTGLDDAQGWRPPPDTEFVVHAMRGPRSAAILRRHGIAAPEVYGDPAWFLPKLLPRPAAPTVELGVILHISELEEPRPDSPPHPGFRRYRVPAELAGSVRIINTYAKRSLEGLLGRLDEILACRRIASTSFHGLLIAEAYGIPAIWFGPHAGGPMTVAVGDDAARLDHRIADFYAGTASESLAIYCQDRATETDWDALMRWIDTAWSPVRYDPAPLFGAFPVQPAVSLDAAEWPLRAATLRSLVP